MHEVLQKANVSPQTWWKWSKEKVVNPSPVMLAEVRRVIEDSPFIRPEDQRRQGRKVKEVGK